ncbi:MAG TPA: DUF2892 domain-containing protein [Opitutaceae bacterium]|jgi:hypothetical protein|nr:DUF2892 domain-containing protein [Opitutaceae bacterium]
MTTKTKIHDGIVGSLVLAGIILGLVGSRIWLYATGSLAVVMISSSFTGFCPVYYLLDRMMGLEW